MREPYMTAAAGLYHIAYSERAIAYRETTAHKRITDIHRERIQMTSADVDRGRHYRVA